MSNRLRGDIWRENFSFTRAFTNGELRKLWKRNEFVQFVINWQPYEAMRRWVQFVEDEQPIEGFKHGQPYTFEGWEIENKNTGETQHMGPFEEFCEWMGIKNKITTAISIARLYPEGCLLVFLDDLDLIPQGRIGRNMQYMWPANPDPQGYVDFKVFQPHTAMTDGKETGTGFEVHDANENGIPTEWKLHLSTLHMKAAKELIIDAERCVHMQWIKTDNEFEATSRVQGLAHVALLEEQMFMFLGKRAHDLAGGILTFTGITPGKEKEVLEKMGGNLTGNDIVFLPPNAEAEYKTPDLKAAGEYASLFDIFTRKLCRHMRTSQLILDGEHTGASLGGGADFEMLNAYTEIYQIQEHFKSDLEHIFFKLGKENTSFIYNDLLPTDIMPEDSDIQGANENDRGTDERSEDGDAKPEDGESQDKPPDE